MNSSIKTILLIVGIVLIGYGIYTLTKIGGMSVEAQDNSNSYITIALGLVSAAIGLLVKKR